MKPKAGTFNIVLLGAWNPAIFSESWVTENLAESADSAVTVAYPIDDPNAPRKIDFEGIILFPGRNQLLLAPVSLDEAGINKCASTLVRILDLLSHTPVGNCGVNFSFEESQIFGSVIEYLEVEDEIPDNYILSSTKLERKFRLQDGNTLNLTISDTDDGAGIGFNYHYEQNEIQAYRDMFHNELAGQKLKEAVNFCHDVYGLTLEELD